MDPLKALTARVQELDLMGPPTQVAEQLFEALTRSGWKLVRYTDHDRLNQEAYAALEQEMGVN